MRTVKAANPSTIVQNLPSQISITPGKPRGKNKQAVTALALSGGAAHGDFEVGVVKYLYNRRGIVPQIICGTSVGSINGLKLAEGEPDKNAKPEADGHVRGLAGLEQIWRSLRHNGDMYTQLDPLTKIEGDLKSALMAAGAGGLIGGSFFGPFGLLVGAFAGASSKVDTIVADLKRLLATRSLANLNPIMQTMKQPTSFKPAFVAQSKIQLRLVMVALDDGKLRMVDEHGRLRERDDTLTPGESPYDAKGQQILQQIKAIEDQIAALEEDAMNPKFGPVEKPPAALIKELRAEEAQLRSQLPSHLLPPQPVSVSLVEAALASSSLPVFFPPQGLGDGRFYVDGGVRMVTPIAPALQLGATEIYAVVASSDRERPGQDVISHTNLASFAPPANLIDIGLRVGADIEPGEINDDQLYPPNGWPVPVIVFRPRVDIHDSMTIDPGLIDIRMDQGWMVADDVMQAYDAHPQQYRSLARQYDDDRNTTLITKLRYAIWKMEFAANGWIYLADGTGSPLPPNKGSPSSEALAKVRQMKENLKGFVEARIAAGGKVPLDYESWWTTWERHSWAPIGPLYPLLSMTTHCAPDQNVALDKPVTITVTAVDSHGKAVPNAKVVRDGAVIGATGKSIKTTFTAKREIKVDPITHAHTITFVMPTLSVEAQGFATTPVAITFAHDF